MSIISESDYLSRLSAFVEQDDLFIGTLTVIEQLNFTVNIFNYCLDLVDGLLIFLLK